MFNWDEHQTLLTGASGFLGSNFRKTMRCLHRKAVVSAPSHKAYDLTYGDHVEELFINHQVKHVPTVLVHMAGLVGGIQANLQRPADFFYDNLVMCAHLLHFGRIYGLKKAVLISAGCGYPEFAPIPTKEQDYWNGYPQAPSAPYSLAKRMQIVQAQAIYKQYGMSSIVVIPGNLFGCFDSFNLENGHVIPALVRRFVEAVESNADSITLWGTGKATRDFIYASDVCEGIIRAAEVYDEPQIVNISSGRENSIDAVAQTLARITGFKGAILWDTSKPDGQARRCFDVSKAKNEMGWEAGTSLYMGLKKTVQWYKENQGVARK